MCVCVYYIYIKEVMLATTIKKYSILKGEKCIHNIKDKNPHLHILL